MWYRTLLAEKSGLLSKIKLGSLLVSAQVDTRYFADFEDAEEILDYTRTVLPKNKCFYEIILGDQKQKPYFDIDVDDITKDGDKIIEELINAIVAVLEPKMGLSLEENVLIFTSHGKSKWSYHVILDGIYFDNNHVNKEFMAQVISKMKHSSEYVDTSMYSSKQQFRIVGSRKYGSERVKIPKINFSVGGVSYKSKMFDMSDLEILESSLVTFIESSFLLPFGDGRKPMRPFNNALDNNFDEAKVFNLAIEVLEKYSQSNVDAFDFSRSDGSMITLKRVKASYCPLCLREHQNENPFITVSPNGCVYFYCRRKVSVKTGGLLSLFLGKVYVEEVEEIKEVEKKRKERDPKKEVESKEEPKEETEPNETSLVGDMNMISLTKDCSVSVDDFFNYM